MHSPMRGSTMNFWVAGLPICRRCSRADSDSLRNFMSRQATQAVHLAISALVLLPPEPELAPGQAPGLLMQGPVIMPMPMRSRTQIAEAAVVVV